MRTTTQCKWIEVDHICKNSAINGKPYCLAHCSRAYISVPPEMADYIIEQELKSTINFTPNIIHPTTDNTGN